jgi:uncharacterized membrane-anchored protein
MGFMNGLLDPTDLGDINKAATMVKGIINIVIGMLGGVMIFLAIYLAYKFMTADDEGKRKNAKGQMIYAIIGVVAIVVILVMWTTVLKPYLQNVNTAT